MKKFTGEDIKKGFGLRIKDFREVHNFSQEYIAEKLSTTNQAISNIERGQTFPLPQRIADIINFFNISPRDLFDFGYKRRSQKVERYMLGTYENMRNKLTDTQIESLYNLSSEFANANNSHLGV